MENISIALPPFAPDYSGICSALFPLNGTLIIHDAGGCTGNYTAYDEPRWFGSRTHVYSSNLRELDAILGDDEFFIQKVRSVSCEVKSDFIALVGSPVPMVIGTDLRSVGRIIEQDVTIPVITFDANGIDYYDTGASAAFLAIAERFVKETDGVQENSVNIIGASPLDLGSTGQVEDISDLLTRAGYDLLSCFGYNTGLSQISQAGRAACNLVVSYSGLEAARYLEERFGTPYCVGIPIGEVSSRELKDTLASCRAGDEREENLGRTTSPAGEGFSSVCIISDQVMGNSLRHCLNREMGIDSATVCSFFGMDEGIAEQGDRHLRSENDAEEVITSGRFDLIIGDPLIKPLTGGLPLISLPHIAISSRLFWDQPLSYVGTGGSEYLRGCMKDLAA